MAIELPITRGEHGRTVRWTFPEWDAGGSDGVEIVLTPLAGEPVTLSGIGGPVAIEPPHTVALTLDDATAAAIVAGTAVDFFDLRGGGRFKLAAGRVKIAGAGQMLAYVPVSGPLFAIQGPPGLIYREDWLAGTYQERDAVSAANSLWYARQQTSEEPSFGSADWVLMLDGSGVAGDRAAAVEAAALAVPAAQTAVNAAELATTAQDAAIAARDQAIAATRFTRIAADGHELVAGSRILADLSAGPLTWSMPAAPGEGDTVGVMVDGNAAASALTLDAVDESFLDGSTLIVDVADARLEIVFLDGFWRF
ncbi:hypothetical protein [Ancylobacter pratisalsi]|uniref:Uncharacterized protein n=1 Tax=Ancylobacter pratisalsi TaxID=1745854 RepID=A0A6P1YNM9_9HYPH|nr:hypothetical protein [Ancylobacter pratisalsi]QIB34735.1 hypothetical protein G3A50_14245 [Ancylobacter pratisalsi]